MMQSRFTAVIFGIFILFSQIGYAVAQNLPDFTPLIENNSAGVVNISTTLKQSNASRQQPGMPQIPEDSPLYDFFEKFLEQMPEGQPLEPYGERSSLGSGFIISRDGYIITNNHVVAEADEIIVRLNDRREFQAKVVGTDPRSDIAVLKIEADDLPVLKLGDSGKLKVGEWVLAIGSPFGFDHSVTQGIVSAIGRALPNDSYIPFIQTDVAINPGNSGGPLFNLEGEVVGVNSQIYSRNGGYMGLSFAVPINVVNDVYEQIRDKGSVSRGWLGVIIQDVTRDLAESFNMKIPRGALVAKVLPDSPAQHSDLEIGDVIVRFNDQDINMSSDLPPIVGSTKVGTKVSVEVIRAGKSRTLTVTIEQLPENLTADADEPQSGPAAGQASNALGVAVAEPDAEQRKQLQLDDYGLLVESVDEGPASRAGIRPGDVILLIDNRKVTDTSQFEQLLGSLPKNKSIPILIQRQGNPTFLAFRIEDE
jgi:serine protease Do